MDRLRHDSRRTPPRVAWRGGLRKHAYFVNVPSLTCMMTSRWIIFLLYLCPNCILPTQLFPTPRPSHALCVFWPLVRVYYDTQKCVNMEVKLRKYNIDLFFCSNWMTHRTFIIYWNRMLNYYRNNKNSFAHSNNCALGLWLRR